MEDWKLKPATDLGLATGSRLRSSRRESGLVETATHWVWWTVIRAYLTAWHRFRVVGREQLSVGPPFVMVANHTSHLDALTLASIFSWRLRDSIFPIAASDTFFQGSVQAAFSAYALNALPVSRRTSGTHSVDDLRRRLATEACAYILFPEGTRARDGRIGEFKAGLGLLVAGTSIPVIPCHIRGAFAALPAGKNLPRPTQIVVNIGAPLYFDRVSNDRTGWLEVAKTSESAVRNLSEMIDDE